MLHILPAVSSLDEGTALIATLTDGQTGSLKRLLVDSGLFDIILHNTPFSSVVQFYKEWDELKPLVTEVLEEAAPHLNMVEHIFCEYHQGYGLDGNRLDRILSVLHHAGFDVTIGKAYSADATPGVRPMTWVSEPYALSIWARKRKWSPALSTLDANAKVIQKESKGPPGKNRPLRESANLALGMVQNEHRRRSQDPEL